MNTDNQNEPVKAMDRYLTPLDIWAMAFGVMVGWGTFVMPGTTFLPIAGPAGTILSMLISVVIMLIIGANFAFIMNRSPRTGGVYTYTKEAFGRDHAFLSSWFLCLSYLTVVFLNGSAIFVVVRTLFGDAVQKGIVYSVAGNDIYFGEIAISVMALAGIGWLFIVAKPILQRLQTVLAVIMFTGITVISVKCLPHVFSRDVLTAFGTKDIPAAYGIFSLVILAPWAFVGFEVISFDTAHFKFKVKKSWLLIFLSILAAGFAYASMAVVGVSAVPDGYASWMEYIGDLDQLKGVASVPTFYAARSIMGPAGLVIIAITALAAILTGVIGAYRASMRVLSTMAEDRILSERFAKTSSSIMFVMVISILISLLGRNTLIWFVDLTALGAIISYGYASASVFKIAKAENNRRAMTTGLIGAVIAVAFVIVQLVPKLTAMQAMGSEAFLLLSLWCLLGFIFYWRTIIHSTLSEYSGMSTSGVVLFALLVYSALMWIAKMLMSRETVSDMQKALVGGGIVVLLIIFVGMVVMLYVQELVRSKHEAVEREKIRAVEGSLAKSRFLFNMSHDIRTPMNAIIGYTRLALKDADTPEMKDYLTKINNSSHHLLSLINDVLEMSRIENGRVDLEYAPADLCAIMDEMKDLFSEQMKQKNLDFSVHTSQIRHPYIWCDQKTLNRVLLNVLSNAYKFTPEGGTVSATVLETGTDENGYGSYEITIRDNGIGMSKEFADKMFNAFERERSSTISGIEGTGLGLSITRSLVDLMGGSIEVLTSPGSGTVFIIRLKFELAKPEEIRKEEPHAEETAQEKGMDFSDKRVLLVEDNEINREIAEMILSQEGFIVECAENGQEAVDKVSASEPGYYDLVLMDIQMPVMDGYEATRTIRKLDNEKLAGIPIVAMTANAFKEDEAAAEDAGMQGHIAKPLDVERMFETISAVLRNAGE